MNVKLNALWLMTLLIVIQQVAIQGCVIAKVKGLIKKVKGITKAAPTSVGCYPDRPHSRDLPTLGGRSTEMTIDFCTETCRAWDTKYMGLQAGNTCWCGQSHGNHGQKGPDSDCNVPCSGKPELTCGGPMHNHIYSL